MPHSIATNRRVPSFERNNNHERFPSVHLQEDFVRIQSWAPAPPSPPADNGGKFFGRLRDSHCAECLRSSLFSLRSRFSSLPRFWRVLCAAFCLLLLFLLATAIILVLVFFVFRTNNDGNDTQNITDAPNTAPPWLLHGQIVETGMFLTFLSPERSRAIVADPVTRERFLAFNGRGTLTIIDKLPFIVQLTEIVISGLDAKQGEICTIYSLASDCILRKQCGVSELSFCCGGGGRVRCSHFSATPLVDLSGELVTVAVEVDGMHIVLENVDSIGCTLLHAKINERFYEQGASVSCGWINTSHSREVAAAGINTRSSTDIHLKSTLSSNGLLEGGPAQSSSLAFSLNSFGSKWSAVGLSFSPHLLLSSFGRGRVLNMARMSSDYIALAEIVIKNDGELLGTFFDNFGALHLWYNKNNTVYIEYLVVKWPKFEE